VYLGLNEKKINLQDGCTINIDFSTLDSFQNQLIEIRPTLVIHTAGLTSVEKCETNPELAYRVNVELSKIVASVTKKLNIPLVHISTDHLFNGMSSLMAEDEPVNAINIYGITKAQAESAVFEINPNALIIRTNFYGWGTSYRKSFSDQIIQSLRNRQTLHLFDDVHYTPIFIENLIQTIHDLVDKKAKGIFHVVSDDRISKYDFGVMIAEEFNLDKSLIKRCSISDKSNLVKRPADMSLSNHKVIELLGRNLGSVKQQIALLHQQEIQGIIKEIQLL
jgi:dTDP-4-dehydrorhamnose reductase